MKNEKLYELVEKAKNGDKSATEILYSEYSDKLYGFVLNRVKNKAVAEDIVQETFLKSMEKISELDDAEKYRSWLYSIARNKCNDWFRENSNSNCISIDDENQNTDYENENYDVVMIPDDYAVNEERKKQLNEIINNLNPDMKTAVLMYYYNDQSMNQIARALGIKENAAKQKLYQARQKLKEKINSLYQKESMLSAVPLSTALRESISPETAAAIKAAGTTAGAVKSTGLASKIIAASAAAAVVVGIPVFLFSRSKPIEQDKSFGVYQELSNSSVNEISTDTYSSISESSEDEAVSNVSSISSSESDDDSGYEETSKNDETSSDDTNEIYDNDISSSAENNDKDNSSESNPRVVNSDRENSSVSDTTTVNKAEEIKNLTGEKMLTMTPNQLFELSDNKYDKIPLNFVQSLAYAYRCSAFPAYCFSINYNDKNKIDAINLYKGAYINDDIYVGMTYNQIKEKNGGKLKIRYVNCNVNFASQIEINGHKWDIAFDLTDEQKKEVRKRIDKLDPNHEMNIANSGQYQVDISDINPTSYVAEPYIEYVEAEK